MPTHDNGIKHWTRPMLHLALHAYSHMHINTHTHTHTHTHMYTYTHARTHTRTHTHAHTHTHTHAHIYTRTRTHTHAHIYTCTHTTCYYKIWRFSNNINTMVLSKEHLPMPTFAPEKKQSTQVSTGQTCCSAKDCFCGPVYVNPYSYINYSVVMAYFNRQDT